MCFFFYNKGDEEMMTTDSSQLNASHTSDELTELGKCLLKHEVNSITLIRTVNHFTSKIALCLIEQLTTQSKLSACPVNYSSLNKTCPIQFNIFFIPPSDSFLPPPGHLHESTSHLV